jgi:hypothetical protein
VALRITTAVFTLILATAGTPLLAQAPLPTPAERAAAPAPLVAADFAVPTLIEAEGFKLAPLGPDLVDVDYQAYMSSIEHLQTTFTRSTGWPHAGITADEAMADMENEQTRFASRASFAYGVLTPDGSRERGSLYVSRSPVAGYDAMVRMWVTKADYDAGFDAELYEWAKGWIAREWPFAKVAYPGRAISWAEWDALIAANKAN